MSSTVPPLENTPGSMKSVFRPEIQKKAKEALRGAAGIVSQESAAIQEQLEEPKELDELAAGIPGTARVPITGHETELKGAAVIAASKKAKATIEKELAAPEHPTKSGQKQPLSQRTISKGPPSSEKMKKIFPRE
jgi:hypothetical protein